MNVVIYRRGALLFEAEYIEDTVDGMIVKHEGETKRLIMDTDYDFSHEVSEDEFGVLYFDKDNRIQSKIVSADLKTKYFEKFLEIPVQYELDAWINEQIEKV